MSKAIHYAAGLLEGEEGYFFSRHTPKQRNAVIGASMTDKEPLVKVAEILGGKVRGPFNYGKRSTNKPFFLWQICSIAKCQEIARKLRPLMSPRRQVAIDKILLMPASHRGKRLTNSNKKCYN